MGKRAKGRSLQEFLPLSVAEKTILDEAAAGGLAEIGETRPETESDANRVRADFLRFLALGGDDEAPVHEKGLQVQGAWITGTLDLSNAEIAGGLVLAKCQFEQTLTLPYAQIGGFFSLEGSAVPGLYADRLTCRSGVFLRGGFTATGEIRLPRAAIGSDLSCGGGTFENPDGPALSADGIKVGGSVFMRGGFSARGEIRLLGATIGGGLDCTGGTFENPEGKALDADGIKVGGNVSMDDNFRARGEVRLPGAAIGGDLSCSGGTFENPNGQAITADGIKVGGNVFMGKAFSAQGEVRLLGAMIGGDLGCRGGSFGDGRENSTAIHCQNLLVSGAFIFDGATVAGGSVDLISAHVVRLVDDRESWPANIVLDGFVYDSFAGDAPTAAKDRLAWLDKQSPQHSGKAKDPREFRPQPWLQLRKVLRDMGHLEDSRQVAIAFEDRKRECGVIGEITAPAAPGDIVACFRQWLKARWLRIRQWLRRRTTRRFHRMHRFCQWLRIQCFGVRQWLQSSTMRGFHWLYGGLIGYGYRPARLFWIVVAVWALSSVLFEIGGHSRVFGPTDPQIFDNPAYDPCNPEKNPRANWTRCQTFPRAYPAFYPPLYALDVLLPVGKLGQEDHWAPLDPKGARTPANKALAWATQIAVWGETLFGWIAGLLLVATVTGLAKRHDE